MNPLVFTKCAGRVFTVLAAITSILFAVGCGSGNGFTKTNPVGFSNSSLTGTYVFSTSGVDASGNFISMAGALMADGNGGIKSGTVDVIDSGASQPFVNESTTGSYGVSTDGRGQAKVGITGAGNFEFDFVLTSTAHGLITEFDGNGTGSGTLDLQTGVPTASQLGAPFAFSLSGIDGNGNSFATVGSFTANAAGFEDFNDAGVVTGESLSVIISEASGTGPGSIELNTSNALTFDYYPIDATHLKLIETDFSFGILAGDAFTQTGASIPVGNVAFTMAGGVSAPVAVGGIMISDGKGNFTKGSFADINNNGTVLTQVPFTGTATAVGKVGGRVVTTLDTNLPATQWVLYPSSGGLLMLETDSLNLTIGAAYAQTSQTLAASQDYGLNLSAFNTTGGFEEDDVAQFTDTSTGFTGVVDINDDAVLSFGQTLSGNDVAPDSTGRGTATTTAGGSAFVSFVFYVVDSSTVVLVETDSNQIGTGTFELQSPSSAAGARPVVSMIRRVGREHAALRRK